MPSEQIATEINCQVPMYRLFKTGGGQCKKAKSVEMIISVRHGSSTTFQIKLDGLFDNGAGQCHTTMRAATGPWQSVIISLGHGTEQHIP